jgi:hypothetical protein
MSERARQYLAERKNNKEKNMSDVMFYGVLRMPYELAMSDELSRKQLYSRAQEAADRAEAAEKRLAQLEAALSSCYCHTGQHLAEVLDLPAPTECQPDVVHPIRTCPVFDRLCTCGPNACGAGPGK